MKKKTPKNRKLTLTILLAIVSGYAEGLSDGIAKTPEQIDRYSTTIFKETLPRRPGKTAEARRDRSRSEHRQGQYGTPRTALRRAQSGRRGHG